MSKIRYSLCLVILCPVFLLFSGCGQETAVYELKDDYETVSGSDAYEKESESKSDGKSNDSEIVPKIIYVYICGAVTNPGVYSLPEGSRVYELINEAGGLLETADERTLNQAEELTDGKQITVYTKEEAADMPVQPSSKDQGISQNGKVNLNTADADRLMTLSGIGEARAEAIIAYREQHGGFQTIEDIMKIEGIKDKLFEKIKEQIEV